MMIPPIQQAIVTSPDVIKLMGATPRFYAFGFTPTQRVYPYGTWQNYGGSPEAYLGTLPDVDTFSIQIDLYSKDSGALLDIAEAVKNAVEPHCYVTRWGVQETITDTSFEAFRYSFDVDWMVLR